MARVIVQDIDINWAEFSTLAGLDLEPVFNGATASVRVNVEGAVLYGTTPLQPDETAELMQLVERITDRIAGSVGAPEAAS